MSPFVVESDAVDLVAAADAPQWPTVSIIVPVYNGDRYLREALESLVAQTVPVHEIVVVDDGSTDASAAVAEAFAVGHPTVRVIRRENGGPGVARNEGIAAATGEFLTFHDADDVMVANRVEVQVGYLLAHPGVEVVISSTDLHLEAEIDPDALWIRKEIGVQEHARGFNLMVMSARTSAFASVGGFDPSYRVSEDVNWLVRALDAGLSVSVLPTIVTHRRLHDQNLSIASDEARREFLRTLYEHIHAGRGNESADDPDDE